MINVSQEFQAAIVAESRRIDILAVVDLSDPDMVKGPVTTSPLAPWSRAEQIWDRQFDTPPRYATLEPGRWLLDRSFDLFPGDYQVKEPMGVASQTLSGADGTFSQPVTIRMKFSDVRILQTLIICFSDDPSDGVGEAFTVEVLSGEAIYYTKTVSGNRGARVTLQGFKVYTPTEIRLTVTKWSLPGRRARILEILTGLYETWNDRMLARFEVTQQGEFSCLSLPYGSVRLAMDNSSRRFEPRRKDSIFESIEDRQNIEIYIGVRLPDGSVEWVRLGRYYMCGDGWKTSDNSLTMEWYLLDIIGLVSNKTFIPPEVLPTTLGGWLQAVVSHSGEAFSKRWHADPNYVNKPVVANNREAVTGKSCGDITRWACMASGTWPRARSEDGRLTAEPLWNQGNNLTLDNLVSYPKMAANQDISALIFELTDAAGSVSEFIVSGNSTSSETTVTIRNPFLHTREQALEAARLILSQYGGNIIETTGRGDPSSEIGDVDTVWLDESNAASGRRMSQSFSIQDGVLQNCRSSLRQADGAYLWEARAELTGTGVWTPPEGVSKLRLFLTGHGEDGGAGEDGTWEALGENGADGQGGLVWSETVSINPGQSFTYSTEGENAVFGPYSSANGRRYPNGYSDIASGHTYARAGVPAPLPGSGDGGAGGRGGRQGVRYREKGTDGHGNPSSHWVIVSRPGQGKAGVPGASGCIIIYWDKEESNG